MDRFCTISILMRQEMMGVAVA